MLRNFCARALLCPDDFPATILRASAENSSSVLGRSAPFVRFVGFGFSGRFFSVLRFSLTPFFRSSSKHLLAGVAVGGMNASATGVTGCNPLTGRADALGCLGAVLLDDGRLLLEGVVGVCRLPHMCRGNPHRRVHCPRSCHHHRSAREAGSRYPWCCHTPSDNRRHRRCMPPWPRSRIAPCTSAPSPCRSSSCMQQA